MAIRTLSLKGADSQSIAFQAAEALAGFMPRVIVFFASGDYAPTYPEREFARVFPKARIIGSTSHSEYQDGNFTTGSVSIMAMDADSIEDVWIEVIPNLNAHADISDTVYEMHEYFGGRDQLFENFEKHVGIILFEGSAKSEEYLMERLKMTTDILFVGGTSSSTENHISRVYADGRAYENAVILAVLKTAKGYDIIKTQSAGIAFERALRVTASDMERRILYEFDGRPCGEVYAEVLGVPVDRIEHYFASNPLGIVAGDDIFIRTFDQITDEGITLHCGVPEGAEIHVLKTGDIVQDTKAALEKVITYEPAGVINFNCLYRTLEILNKGQVEPYSALFGKYRSIGFSTYGEAYLGRINETLVILVIK